MTKFINPEHYEQTEFLSFTIHIAGFFSAYFEIDPSQPNFSLPGEQMSKIQWNPQFFYLVGILDQTY